MSDHRGPRILTIMGSGETAPTMMKHHRDLLGRLGSSPAAVVLDTPYGFQENAAELAHKAVEYFRQSVGFDIEIAGLTQMLDVDPVLIEQGLNRLRRADYVFAGPGSPTYALRQWAETAVPDIMREKLRTGGAVTFSSAAALTLGRFTVPVYEIYKVGAEPYWLDGLDVLAEIGVNAAVIPHYDNAEGGHHDTRFCYLGERRLRIMEELLPDDASVIGLDEHTGIVIDVDSGIATVIGNGSLTVRVRGHSVTHAAGETVPLDALREPSAHGRSVTAVPAPPSSPSSPDTLPATSLSAEVSEAEQSFDDALQDGDAPGAARAVLNLEAAIRRWSADTLQSDDMDRAHGALRSMIVRLGEAATRGLVDPRAIAEPYMTLLLDLRSAVRADKRYDLSDLIRDRLGSIGIEVRDTPNGVEWELRPSQD